LIDMRRFMGLAVLALLASSAKAQDTIVVIVRHIPAQQDTGVIVRPLAPPPQRTAQPYRAQPYGAQPYGAQPYGAPRYAPGATAVVAKNPYAGTMLSFVFPGGGQYYAGATAKGLAISLIGIGAPIIGFASVNREHTRYDGFAPQYAGNNCAAYGGGPALNGARDCRGRYDWAPALTGLGVGVAAWLYGVATAGSDVQHWNQAHGVRFVTAPGRAGFAVALP
jgi:hypothetical protein